MITALTPTGDRPLPFALCQKWMENQTMPADQWIVVDDGKVPMVSSIHMEYVRRLPQPTDPHNTQNLNIQAALPFIKGNKIIIIEDDEYYAPDYIKDMAAWLDKYEVVGICRSKYYYIPTCGYYIHANINRASLAQTVFRSSFLPELEALLKIPRILDMPLWELVGGIRPLYASRLAPRQNLIKLGRAALFVDSPKSLYVGIKGLPGRNGLGSGHSAQRYHTHDTKDKQILRKWIPADYQIYLDVMGGKLTEENYHYYFGWRK
jgi:hypothetical protein